MDYAWSGNPARWSQKQKVTSLSSPFALQLVRIMDELEEEGFEPSIRLAWRNLGTQRELKKKGVSDVSFSRHNLVNEDGLPAAIAADVIDRRYGWGEGSLKARRNAARFFKRYGDLAQELGLAWGGDPGLYNLDREGNVWKPYGMAWDPAHVFEDLSPEDWQVAKAVSIDAIAKPMRLVAKYGEGGTASASSDARDRAAAVGVLFAAAGLALWSLVR